MPPKSLKRRATTASPKTAPPPKVARTGDSTIPAATSQAQPASTAPAHTSVTQSQAQKPKNGETLEDAKSRAEAQRILMKRTKQDIVNDAIQRNVTLDTTLTKANLVKKFLDQVWPLKARDKVAPNAASRSLQPSASSNTEQDPSFTDQKASNVFQDEHHPAKTPQISAVRADLTQGSSRSTTSHATQTDFTASAGTQTGPEMSTQTTETSGYIEETDNPVEQNDTSAVGPNDKSWKSPSTVLAEHQAQGLPMVDLLPFCNSHAMLTHAGTRSRADGRRALRPEPKGALISQDSDAKHIDRMMKRYGRSGFFGSAQNQNVALTARAINPNEDWLSNAKKLFDYELTGAAYHSDELLKWIADEATRRIGSVTKETQEQAARRLQSSLSQWSTERQNLSTRPESDNQEDNSFSKGNSVSPSAPAPKTTNQRDALDIELFGEDDDTTEAFEDDQQFLHGNGYASDDSECDDYNDGNSDDDEEQVDFSFSPEDQDFPATSCSNDSNAESPASDRYIDKRSMPRSQSPYLQRPGTSTVVQGQTQSDAGRTTVNSTNGISSEPVSPHTVTAPSHADQHGPQTSTSIARKSPSIDSTRSSPNTTVSSLDFGPYPKSSTEIAPNPYPALLPTATQPSGNNPWHQILDIMDELRAIHSGPPGVRLPPMNPSLRNTMRGHAHLQVEVDAAPRDANGTLRRGPRDTEDRFNFDDSAGHQDQRHPAEYGVQYESDEETEVDKRFHGFFGA